MISPGWLATALAVVVLGVAAFSAVRLAGLRGRRWRGELDADVAHLLMGVAMAGMLLPRLRTLPAGAWDIVFAAAAAWFGWRAVRAHRARLASRADPASPAATSAQTGPRSRPTGSLRRWMSRWAHQGGTYGTSTTGIADASGSAADVAATEAAVTAEAAIATRVLRSSNPSSASDPSSTSSLSSALSPYSHTGRTGVAGLGGRRLAGPYCRHPLPHLIDCVAMLFMLWAGPALAAGAAGAAEAAAGAGMAGMGGAISGVRLPALVLALCICGYIVWLGDRIQVLALAAPAAGQAGQAAQTGHRLVLAPRLGTCCKIAMGVAMGVMLIDLI